MATCPIKQRYRDTPKGAYNTHKVNARNRGVPFELTFGQWWAVWEGSGKWKKRGSKHGCYVMSRIGDAGGYTFDNVYIAPWLDNSRAGCRKAARSKTASNFNFEN